MKKLLILLLLTSCVNQPMEPGCSLYVNRTSNGIQTVTQYGKTCITPDGRIVTTIDHTEMQINTPGIYIPKPPFKR